MNHSESINEIAVALSAMQGEMANPAKNSRNPHFGNKYADLTEILDTVRPAMARHGLSLCQSAYCDGDQTFLSTILMHISGQFLTATTNCKSSKDQLAQGFGSDQTYLKRYQICSMLGVSAEDDLDGEQIASKPKAVNKPVLKVAPIQAGYSHTEVLEEDVATIFSELKITAHDGGHEAFLKLWRATNPVIKKILNADTARMGALNLECQIYKAKAEAQG